MRNVGNLFLLGVLAGACNQAKKEPPIPAESTPTQKTNPSLTITKTEPGRLVPTQPQDELTPSIEHLETNGLELSVSLRVIDLPAQDELALSKITLKLQEPNKPAVTRDLGELPGCSSIEPLEEKILSSVQCFWPGGEDTFELLQEEDVLSVRHAILNHDDEPEPKPEELLRVSLQKGARVHVSYRGDNLEITPEHVGPYKLAMTSKDALLLPNADLVDEELISFEPDGVELFLQNGSVCSIAMSSRGPRTKDGLGVGSSIAEIQKQYGAAKWDESFSALSFEKEPRLHVVVSYEEVGREHKLPRPEAKVTNILVGNCEASEPK